MHCLRSYCSQKIWLWNPHMILFWHFCIVFNLYRYSYLVLHMYLILPMRQSNVFPMMYQLLTFLMGICYHKFNNHWWVNIFLVSTCEIKYFSVHYHKVFKINASICNQKRTSFVCCIMFYFHKKKIAALSLCDESKMSSYLKLL